MLRGVLWFGLCGAVAIAAVFLEVDRQSRYDPGLARNVPALFRGFAQQQLAVDALRAKDADALEQASELVRRRPVPAEHLALLGLAAAQANRPELAERAILLSARRGWRVPLVQYAIAQAALDQGQPKVAADRLMALWLTGADPEILVPATQSVLSRRRARWAFAKEMAEVPGVQARFLQQAVKDLDPLVFAATVARASRLGASFDCAELSSAADRLVRNGAADAALGVWQGQCDGVPTGPSDFAFGPEPGVAPGGPFDWRFPSHAGLSLSWRLVNGTWVIDYSNSDPISAIMAQKFAALRPGNHELSVIWDEGDPASARRPVLAVWCLHDDGTRQWLGSPTSNFRFEVPASGCPVQLVQLQGPKGRANGLRVVLRRTFAAAGRMAIVR